MQSWLRHTVFFLEDLRTYLERYTIRVSLVAQRVKNLPAVQETRVWSLDQEDPVERGMDSHSSIFAWRIPWTEEPDRLKSMGRQIVGHDWATELKCSFSFTELRMWFTQHHFLNPSLSRLVFLFSTTKLWFLIIFTSNQCCSALFIWIIWIVFKNIHDWAQP